MFEFLKKLNPYYHRSFIREALALRVERGPYRFAIRTWEGISDIDLAVRVLQTEFFGNEVKPSILPVKQVKSILILAPHQDDETIGAGGTLLLASQAGVKIDVLYVTDGAQNKDHVQNDNQVREDEAREVCSKLGAHIHHLGISNLNPQLTMEDVKRLWDIINRLKPQVILAPWILDLPVKHRLVNHLLWLANAYNRLPDCEVWGYQVHNTPFVNGYVDITGVAEEKRELLECYKSQIHYRRYDHMAMGMAAWNTRFLDSYTDSLYVEVFFALPSREFFRLVESFYLSDLRATYRGHKQLISPITEIHRMINEGALQRGFLKSGRNWKKRIKKSAPAALLLIQSLLNITF